MMALKRKEARRPCVSATTPVGISNNTMPAVKAALAMNTSEIFKPASSKKRVFTPQITDADSVYSPAITR